MRSRSIRLVLFFFLLLTCFYLVHAQQVSVEGFVMEAGKQKPLEGVMVVVYSVHPRKMVAYTQSDDQGRFRLSFSSVQDVRYELKCSMMSFESSVQPVIDGRKIYNVVLKEKAIDLKEVTIKSRSIFDKGDTVVYVVSQFAGREDKSLSDVLKRVPGIEVDKSGLIKYNGTPINKFYVEGKDMLGDRYGLATNNIQQQDVARIEVMENHQPIKALEDISFSRNPAINIRLKEQAKSRYIGVALAGAGFTPLLYQGETSLMRFKKSSQMLYTFKTNNIGNDVTQETSVQEIAGRISGFGRNYRLKDYVHVAPALLADLEENRTLFNHSYAASANNLWGITENSNLSMQFTYIKNRFDSEREMIMTDYMMDSTVVTNTATQGFRRMRRLTGDFIWETNRKDYFVRNKLSARFITDRTEIENRGTYDNRQQASLPARYYANDLHLIKRIDNKFYTLKSFNSYETKEQELQVIRKKASGIQNIHSHAFYTNTHTHLTFLLKPVMLSVKLGLIGAFRSMESHLTGPENISGVLDNRLNMRYFYPYAETGVSYKKPHWELKGTLPVSFVSYSFYDRLGKEKQHHQQLYVSPALNIRYLPSSRLSTAFSASIDKRSVDEQIFYRGILLNDYRNVSLGITDFDTGSDKRFSWNVSYRDALKRLFFSANISRVLSNYPRIANRVYSKEYIVHGYIGRQTQMKTWMANGNISKGVESINGFISLSAEGTRFNGALYQNDASYGYTSQRWRLTPKITSRLSRWCNISYRFSYFRSKMDMEALRQSYSYRQLFGQFSCGISTGKNWLLHFKAEHYHNEHISGRLKHFFLTDIDFTFNFRDGMEMNLAAKNLFDRRIYDYVQFGELSKMQTVYHVRPRNILFSLYFRI
ncbi:Outer membrane cobalamin receptor protein [Porphyromonas macacae]|uniref:Outer membrane cobalamin receptor protein n=2 Tax=Porphyromonas macacae TaxID=28115 RepID=A0A379DFV6_9PORP|nr:Outer membrane cobalamin receptor protein [Porphyromonas macacae]